MKVLMFGWEFPPHILGGLGTAGIRNHYRKRKDCQQYKQRRKSAVRLQDAVERRIPAAIPYLVHESEIGLSHQIQMPL